MYIIVSFQFLHLLCITKVDIVLKIRLKHIPSLYYIWNMFAGEQEWQLMGHVAAQQVEEEKMKSGAVNAYPLYNITVNVKRKPSYYMWNVALIMVSLMDCNTVQRMRNQHGIHRRTLIGSREEE